MGRYVKHRANNNNRRGGPAPKGNSYHSEGPVKVDFTKRSRMERSAYFDRREAAKVLRSILQGDARRQAVASIKSLVFSPSVRNKKVTFALVCQTLKYLSTIKQVLNAVDALNGPWMRQRELIYIITYDILFGQEMPPVGDAEKFLLLRKEDLKSALTEIMANKEIKQVEDLTAANQFPDISRPRYVRVNTLKCDVESAMLKLGKTHKVQKDDMVPDLLILPKGTDLHKHPLVKDGSVFLQGKVSSMVALALDPKPEWKVLDACAAPGNKTIHLASLMKGRGKVIACELNKDRAKRLYERIILSGAPNVKVQQGDFLELDPKDTLYSKVRAILLDPSCSGSGTTSERLDHLLPSFEANHASDAAADTSRLNKLAAFQRKALTHALSFPAVERVVYSTCSIHQIENEDVIQSVLPHAKSRGFELQKIFPQWPRRGLPVLESSEQLLRADPKEDKEGFFIALFVRTTKISESGVSTDNNDNVVKDRKSNNLKEKDPVNNALGDSREVKVTVRKVTKNGQNRNEVKNTGNSGVEDGQLEATTKRKSMSNAEQLPPTTTKKRRHARWFSTKISRLLWPQPIWSIQ